MNGKTTQWILIALSILALAGGLLAWTSSTFETKESAQFKFQILEKKIDRILDYLEDK